MIDAAGRGQAHHHETRQRHGFEKPAAGRLHPLKHFQAAAHARAAARARASGFHGPRWKKPCLSDGHQRRHGIADHAEPQEAKHRMRQAGQLEGQAPARAATAVKPGQRAVGQDRRGECPVVAVTLPQAVQPALGVEVLLRPARDRPALRRPRRQGARRRGPAAWRLDWRSCDPCRPSRRRRSGSAASHWAARPGQLAIAVAAGVVGRRCRPPRPGAAAVAVDSAELDSRPTQWPAASRSANRSCRTV